MLDQSTRAAILKLREQGHSIRSIARALKVSRGAVRDVLRSATEQVPTLVRPEKATPYRDQILELYVRCKGNLVRVHEELVASGAQLSYQALTVAPLARSHLKPLPVWTPPVYLLHQRLVDLEGYVSVDTNRYSVPADLIGRGVVPLRAARSANSPNWSSFPRRSMWCLLGPPVSGKPGSPQASC